MSKWVIYSKNQCPYCDKAKFALKNEPFLEVKNISENPEFFTELMEKNPNARTMPQIYKDDQISNVSVSCLMIVDVLKEIVFCSVFSPTLTK